MEAFEDLARSHNLTRFTIYKFLCQCCAGASIYSASDLPPTAVCVACGMPRRVMRLRVKAATSRPLPLTVIGKAMRWNGAPRL